MSESGPLPAYVEDRPDGVAVYVYVQPNAAKDDVVGVHGRALKLKVKAPPVDDRANEAAIALLAARLGLPLSAVVLVGGRASRNKRFRVATLPAAEVASALERVLSSRAP